MSRGLRSRVQDALLGVVEDASLRRSPRAFDDAELSAVDGDDAIERSAHPAKGTRSRATENQLNLSIAKVDAPHVQKRVELLRSPTSTILIDDKYLGRSSGPRHLGAKPEVRCLKRRRAFATLPRP